jgi:hypothetical protein
LKEHLRDVATQQAVAILGEHSRIPHLVIHVQSHKPPVQQVVIELLHVGPQRMILGNAFFRRNVAVHAGLMWIVTSHASQTFALT